MRWVFFIILPWAAILFKQQVMGSAFIFSLKKFVDNPAGLTFILSLPAFIAMVVAPINSFLSDRVWTRYGRRKPFIVVSWIGIIAGLLMMPLATNMYWLIAAYLLYNLFNDIGASPTEVIKQEVVPPHQRGRATAIMQWISNFNSLLFFYIALGRFDEVQFMRGFSLDGETAIYWSGGMMIIVMLFLVMLGIKETDPKSEFRGQKLSFGNFFRGLADRELWPVYTLIFASAMLTSGLGAMTNLLYTEQWNYTKQDVGLNVAVGTTINLVLIIFIGFFADKFNRLKAYQTLIAVALFLKCSYYCYVEFVLADKRPSLVEIILFGELLSICSILTQVVYMPMVYDFIRRNKMGTYSAGAGLIGRVTHLLTLNGVGLFITGYAAMFQPPSGEMVRVVLHDEASKTQLRSMLDKTAWVKPQNSQPMSSSDVQADAWYATGLVDDTGRCWEVRLRNKDSEQLFNEKEKLESDRSKLITSQKLDRDHMTALTRDNNMQAIPDLEKKVQATGAQIDELTKQIDGIKPVLADRAENFKQQITKSFEGLILTDGEQVRSASLGQALIIELATTRKPPSHAAEKALGDLRISNAGVIDIRPVKRGDNYGLAISGLLPSGGNEEQLAGELQTALQQALEARSPGLMKQGTAVLSRTTEPVVMLDLLVIEDPLDTRISPVTRVVHMIQKTFMDAPTPDRRLNAVGRGLREAGQTDHVRITPAKDAKTISVVAAFSSQATKAQSIDDAVGQRLSQLFGDQASADTLAQVRSFYDRIVKVGAVQRVTIAQPFVSTGYAKMKYDYMCGYIWMFLLGSIGLLITLAFGRRERRGLIRKHGVEEAQAS